MTCIGKDPRCPCQDGDACHYKDCGGTKAWPVPKAEPPPEWPLIKNILAVFGLDAIAFVAEWKAAQRKPLTDEQVNECGMCGYVGKDKDKTGQCPKCRWDELRPLTGKAHQKPLTDDQIYEMYNEPRSDAEMLEFARAIEAAHGIKEGT